MSEPASESAQYANDYQAMLAGQAIADAERVVWNAENAENSDD